jgi:hypothetical protein
MQVFNCQCILAFEVNDEDMQGHTPALGFGVGQVKQHCAIFAAA